MRARFALALGFILIACSRETGEDESTLVGELATNGRWALPSDVLDIGAKVHLTYDGPPAWSSKNCTGKLQTGTSKLGSYLREEFGGVTSVGGYACRPNTANSKELSVHGTGRALDVFIPRVGGLADNTKGDEVANWLVSNATPIGVQLVIWDKTIWRANGTNDKAYGGPNPHTDHLHVELTEEAARMETPWFSASFDGGVPSQRPDAGNQRDASAPPPPPPPPEDAGTTTPPPQDAGTTTPPPAPVDAGAPDPKKKDEPKYPSDNWENEADDEDEPGETDSLEPSTTKKQPSATYGIDDSSSCSASPLSTGANALPILALGLAVTFIQRRRSRRK